MASKSHVFDHGAKHALPPNVRAGQRGSKAMVLAFVPVGYQDSALDGSASSVRPVRVELLAAATHRDPRAGFSLRLAIARIR